MENLIFSVSSKHNIFIYKVIFHPCVWLLEIQSWSSIWPKINSWCLFVLAFPWVKIVPNCLLVVQWILSKKMHPWKKGSASSHTMLHWLVVVSGLWIWLDLLDSCQMRHVVQSGNSWNLSEPHELEWIPCPTSLPQLHVDKISPPLPASVANGKWTEIVRKKLVKLKKCPEENESFDSTWKDLYRWYLFFNSPLNA